MIFCNKTSNVCFYSYYLLNLVNLVGRKKKNSVFSDLLWMRFYPKQLEIYIENTFYGLFIAWVSNTWSCCTIRPIQTWVFATDSLKEPAHMSHLFVNQFLYCMQSDPVFLSHHIRFRPTSQIHNFFCSDAAASAQDSLL